MVRPNQAIFTPEERIERMSKLAKLKASKMSAESRKAHAQMMLKKRWNKAKKQKKG